MDRRCPLCSGENISTWYETGNVTLVECETCNFVFSRFPNNQESLSGFYGGSYAEGRGHNKKEIEACKYKSFDYYFQKLSTYLHNPHPKLLEIGCSTGTALQVAVDRGWQVYGLDVSERSIEIARRKLERDTIRVGDLFDNPFGNDSFDVIALFDVIEHIREPVRVFKRLRALLSDNGLILFVTPNIKSLSAKLLRSKWPHLLDEHVSYFSPKSIRLLATELSLQVLEMGFAWKFISPDVLYRHWRLHPHVFGASIGPPLFSLLPSRLRQLAVPFNLGEFYGILRKQPSLRYTCNDDKVTFW